jgi:hypothetical protein
MMAQLKSLPAEIGSQAEKIAKSFSSSKSSAPIKKPRIDMEMEARHGRVSIPAIYIPKLRHEFTFLF